MNRSVRKVGDHCYSVFTVSASVVQVWSFRRTGPAEPSIPVTGDKLRFGHSKRKKAFKQACVPIVHGSCISVSEGP